MVAGVFARNMTDDFFVQDVALFYWSLAGMLFGYPLRCRVAERPGRIDRVFGRRGRAGARPLLRKSETASRSLALEATPPFGCWTIC